MFHKPETSLSWKECLNQPQVGFASFFLHVGGPFHNLEHFSNSQGQRVLFTPPFMDQHHFQPQKHDPPPKHKNILKSISPKNHHPRLVGRIGGIRITGLHLGWSHHWYPRTAGGPRFSQGPWKTTRLCTENSISKYFGWGGFLEDSLPTFLETTSFGGSENLMVGDYTLFLEFWRTFPFVRCQWRQFYRFAFEGWRKRQWFCLAVRNGNLIRSRKPYCFDLGWA